MAVLESDVLRTVFTPHPRYDEEERNTFYRQLVYVGTLLAKHGVPVIFDATANRRIYRDHAREQIPRFLEVYVECPLEVCMSQGSQGNLSSGPGGDCDHRARSSRHLRTSGESGCCRARRLGSAGNRSTADRVEADREKLYRALSARFELTVGRGCYNGFVAERWQSGRLRRSRKPLNLYGFREFESPPLRHP